MKKNNLQKGIAAPWIILTVILAVVAIGGAYVFFQQQPPSVQGPAENPTVEVRDEGAATNTGETKYSGAILAGSSSPLLDFTKADYDAAIKSDKLIVLYFYANWCPICKEEVARALYPAFNELTTDKVIGFRVNYNDNQTDRDEKNLAREFGVAYQHTKVFLKDQQRILKSPESWNKERYFQEIQNRLQTP